jgi:hypothetical protein
MHWKILARQTSNLTIESELPGQSLETLERWAVTEYVDLKQQASQGAIKMLKDILNKLIMQTEHTFEIAAANEMEITNKQRYQLPLSRTVHSSIFYFENYSKAVRATHAKTPVQFKRTLASRTSSRTSFAPQVSKHPQNKILSERPQWRKEVAKTCHRHLFKCYAWF